jgi:hypothetical protein
MQVEAIFLPSEESQLHFLWRDFDKPDRPIFDDDPDYNQIFTRDLALAGVSVGFLKIFGEVYDDTVEIEVRKFPAPDDDTPEPCLLEIWLDGEDARRLGAALTLAANRDDFPSDETD